MLKLRRIAALFFALGAAGAMSLASAQASHAATILGPVEIQNVGASGLCVQLNPATSDKDIQLVQEPCNGSDPAQQWLLFSGLDNGQYSIINVKTGMCMRAVSNRDFAVVDTIDCTSISNEVWTFQASNTPGASVIKSEISTGGEPCLDVQEASPNPGALIDVFHCTRDNNAQTFRTVFV
jgi:hypothetical protein